MTSAIENNKYTFKEPRRQYFAFPFDVISHLLINPKFGNGLEKLYQTCKYFFSKRKILVINQYGHIRGNHLYYTVYQKNASLQKTANIQRTQALLWPTGLFAISNPLPTTFKNIYRCSAYRLVINDATLSYNEFELLVSENTVKDFQIRCSSIYYFNGAHVTLDVILKNLPNIEKFIYRNKNETYSIETLQKMTQIPLNIKLNYCLFYIVDISNDFDPALLCKFFEQHPMCSYTVYIQNQRYSEIKQNIETVLKNIFENDKETKLNVSIFFKA